MTDRLEVHALDPADGVDGQVPVISGGKFVIGDASSAATALDGLTDVDTTTTAPVDGDTLMYDAASDLWVPGAPTGGPGGSTGDTSWTLVSFQNGWMNYDAATYSAAGFRKDGSGFVHLRGLVKSGTFQTAIFTLPAGYRPAGVRGYAVVSNGGLGQINVYGTGMVALNISPAGSVASAYLDGISFFAEG